MNGDDRKVVDIGSSKEIQNSVDIDKENENLDQHGRMKHEDIIVLRLNHKELLFIHQAIRDVLETNPPIVPPDEVGPTISLLEMLSAQEKEIYNHSQLVLPVNYCVGLWHCLNTGRKFHIYKKRKGKDNHLDKTVRNIAESLDAYHKVKSHEKNEERINIDPDGIQYFETDEGMDKIQKLLGQFKEE